MPRALSSTTAAVPADLEALARARRLIATFVDPEAEAVDVTLTDSDTSIAVRGRPRRPPAIRLRRGAIAGGNPSLLGELAHEYAHLIDEDAARERRLRLTVILLLVLIPGAVLVALTVPSAAVSGSTRLVTWLIWMTGMGCGFPWIRRLNHRCELRADLTAARIVGSAPVLAMLELFAAEYAGLSRSQQLFRTLTHPTPQRRRAAVAAHFELA